MNEQELEIFLEENKKLISAGNAKKILRKVYEKTDETDPKIVYDFLGQILIEKPVLQERKNLSKFLRGYDDFIQVKKDFGETPKQLLELEKYFLEKYCIFEGEMILCYFSGIVHIKTMFSSRVFITNYRIIVLSHVFKTSTTYMPWAGIVFNVLNLITDKAIHAKSNSIIKSAEQSSAKPFLGYQFPILNPTTIILSKKKKGKNKEKARAVKFTSTFQTKSLDIKITVNKKVHGDSENILYKVEKILQSLQEQQTSLT